MADDCGGRGRTPSRSRSAGKGGRPHREGAAVQREILLPGAVPAELLSHGPSHELSHIVRSAYASIARRIAWASAAGEYSSNRKPLTPSMMLSFRPPTRRATGTAP